MVVGWPGVWQGVWEQVYNYGGPQLSRQNQKRHGKNKIPHDKTKTLTAKYFTAKTKYLTAKANTRGKTKAILFLL